MLDKFELTAQGSSKKKVKNREDEIEQVYSVSYSQVRLSQIPVPEIIHSNEFSSASIYYGNSLMRSNVDRP